MKPSVLSQVASMYSSRDGAERGKQQQQQHQQPRSGRLASCMRRREAKAGKAMFSHASPLHMARAQRFYGSCTATFAASIGPRGALCMHVRSHQPEALHAGVHGNISTQQKPTLARTRSGQMVEALVCIHIEECAAQRSHKQRYRARSAPVHFSAPVYESTATV